ncbi:choice-of-anchor B family protein [Kangiella sp. TOML190]|uniref:choice-of-anchor B family protein n=1 Tax=Kangiella sp. TOML190 TaxID=2931351 RepID=UPI00203FD9F9|nr:choice-of-anchor B family protein [Kangiella sp. TOML190]
MTLIMVRRSVNVCAALLIAAISLPVFSHGGGHPIRYIASDGVDKGDCSSPTKPCKTIAYAVNKSSKGDKIQMAAGNYHAKNMDIFYLLNDMVAISGGYSRLDGYQNKSAENITTIVGLPAKYRDQLAAKGFKLLSDTKGNDQYRIKPDYLKLLAKYQKINSSFEKNIDCSSGMADNYPCNNINLLSHLPLSQMSSTPSSGNDIWGYRDLNTGREYAVMGLFNGTILVDVSDPSAPQEVGTISGVSSTWRDVKVYQFFDPLAKKYQAYAYVTTEGNGGFQVIDLTKAPDSISLANTINVFQTAHNVYLGNIDYATGLPLDNQEAYLYIAGSNNGNGSYRIFDLKNPANPNLVTTPPNTGYVHDATNLSISDSRTSQCANGHNPCELFIDFNENTMDIWDTTDKANPVKLSATGYSGAQYTHSGWYSQDKNYIFIQDELDEQRDGLNTTLYVMDIRDLTSPKIVGSYVGPTRAIDHNGFTLGDKYYMSNYKRGLTILDVSNPATPAEIGFFDTFPVPAANDPQFDGAWGAYPYLPSGNILVSDISNGLYVLEDNSGTQANQVGSIELLLSSASYDEANATIAVAVSRAAGSNGSVSLDYELQAQSATAGEDFAPASGSLSWADGQSGVQYIDIQLLDDTSEEAAENFSLILSNVQGGATLNSDTFTVNIKASDGPLRGTVGLTSTASSIEEAATSLDILVARTGGSDGEVTVNYATQDNSATAGQDYTAANGSLSWADGDASDKTISISILDDSAQENDENFSLLLSDPQGGAALGTSSYSITIRQNDQPTPPPPPPSSGGGGGPIAPLMLLTLLSILLYRVRLVRSF